MTKREYQKIADYLIKRFKHLKENNPTEEDLKLIREFVSFIAEVVDYNFKWERFVDYIDRRNEKLAEIINKT